MIEIMDISTEVLVCKRCVYFSLTFVVCTCTTKQTPHVFGSNRTTQAVAVVAADTAVVAAAVDTAAAGPLVAAPLAAVDTAVGPLVADTAADPLAVAVAADTAHLQAGSTAVLLKEVASGSNHR